MMHILHVVDSSAGWEQQTALAQLLDRLPVPQHVQKVAALSATARTQPIEILPWFSSIPWLGGPLMRNTARRFGADVIHAWGVDAAIAAASFDSPLVVHLFHPRMSAREMKALRALDRSAGFGVACASGTVRRRIIEGGIPADRCALIRPGVDFGWLGRQHRADVRNQLGLSLTDYVVLVSEPATRTGGHMEAAFACELASFVTPHIRMVLPGKSREHSRIRRFFADQPHPEVLICPDPDTPFLQLLAAADVFVAAPFVETSSTAIAWAMAAGVAVLGVADYSVAELITHKVNGRLFKPVRVEGRAVTLAKILAQAQTNGALREAARGQAYEVFSIRRCMDQHIRLYENVIAGQAASEGISDAAIVA